MNRSRDPREMGLYDGGNLCVVVVGLRLVATLFLGGFPCTVLHSKCSAQNTGSVKILC